MLVFAQSSSWIDLGIAGKQISFGCIDMREVTVDPQRPEDREDGRVAK